MKMNEVIGRIMEIVDIVRYAMLCMFKTATGQETDDCTACWKCMALRWFVFGLIMYVMYKLFTAWFFLVVAVAVALLLWKGKGPWAAIRDEIVGFWNRNRNKS